MCVNYLSSVRVQPHPDGGDDYYIVAVRKDGAVFYGDHSPILSAVKTRAEHFADFCGVPYEGVVSVTSRN